MRIQKAQSILMQKIWARFVVLFWIIGTMVGLGLALGPWAVVVVLALLLGLTGSLLLRSAVSVEFIDEEEKVQTEATKLLKGTKQNLYYYGGVGFIGDYQHWRDEFNNKLGNESIQIARFLDSKSVSEMKTMLKGTMQKEEINKEIDKYAQWLTIHSKNLKYRFANNFLYHFEGAPIWKYGFHYIIFDKKHIVMPFVSSARKTRNAIFIRDCPEIAAALVDSLDWLAYNLELKRMSSDELKALARLPKVSGERGIKR